MEMHKVEKFIVNTPATTLLHGHVLLRKALRQARPLAGRVLEVGCGRGATSKILLRRFPGIQLTAVDFDQEQVARAQAGLQGRAMVEQGDVNELRYSGDSFDHVVELNVLHHVADPGRALREIHRVLRPGGQLVFTDYTGEFFRGPIRTVFPPETTFSAAEFLQMLQAAGFRVDSYQGSWVVVGSATKPSPA